MPDRCLCNLSLSFYSYRVSPAPFSNYSITSFSVGSAMSAIHNLTLGYAVAAYPKYHYSFLLLKGYVQSCIQDKFCISCLLLLLVYQGSFGNCLLQKVLLYPSSDILKETLQFFPYSALQLLQHCDFFYQLVHSCFCFYT